MKDGYNIKINIGETSQIDYIVQYNGVEIGLTRKFESNQEKVDFGQIWAKVYKVYEVLTKN
jgi:hypothetical protein